MDALTLFSYGVIGFLIAPVAVLVLASLHKETRRGLVNGLPARLGGAEVFFSESRPASTHADEK